ncbi:unnamed protein product [Cylicocyclus nassatus]|uniref:Uncharacterized protein n=1 Tax=Cylicocyclus nassatus TaxID=53992 RepID=A0AA36H6R2_CYLNA|nr:unnamed protein product [Cylicocyclus nassatus]
MFKYIQCVIRCFRAADKKQKILVSAEFESGRLLPKFCFNISILSALYHIVLRVWSEVASGYFRNEALDKISVANGGCPRK